MTIISKRVFEANPFQIWTIVSDPENMPAWNPKCATCKRLGGLDAGTRFEAVFQWRQKRYQCQGEITPWQQNAKVTYRMHYEHNARLGTIDESYQLKAIDLRRTELVHTVDFSHSTLPFWVKLLIGFLGRFGRKTDQDSMDHIQDLLTSGLR